MGDSNLLGREDTCNFPVLGPLNVLGDCTEDHKGWQPSPGTSNSFPLLLLLSSDFCSLCPCQAREMKKQLIDDFLSQNKFLMVARLTSQRLFQELCPVKKSHRQRK